MRVVTAEELLRDVCRTVHSEGLFPDGSDTKVDWKLVDDQIFELQKLSVDLQRVALDARAGGASPDALWQALWRVIR